MLFVIFYALEELLNIFALGDLNAKFPIGRFWRFQVHLYINIQYIILKTEFVIDKIFHRQELCHRLDKI